jgi:hypothetical protein
MRVNLDQNTILHRMVFAVIPPEKASVLHSGWLAKRNFLESLRAVSGAPEKEGGC